MHLYLVWFSQFQLFQKITDIVTLVTLQLYHLPIFWVFNNSSISVEFLQRRKKKKILNTWPFLFQGQLSLSTALPCYSLLAFRIWRFQNTPMKQDMFLFRTTLGTVFIHPQGAPFFTRKYACLIKICSKLGVRLITEYFRATKYNFSKFP